MMLSLENKMMMMMMMMLNATQEEKDRGRQVLSRQLSRAGRVLNAQRGMRWAGFARSKSLVHFYGRVYAGNQICAHVHNT